jgi:DNA replication and repair protein RecF
MAISTIRLQHFRSYSDESFEFEPKVNIIVGPNASGKTNLLEAVLALAIGGSYRARDIELVQLGKKWSRLDGYFGEQQRTMKLERQDDSALKSFEIDAKPFKQLSFERTLPVVFFEPNHLQLITRGPEKRREFIDELLERTEAGMKSLTAAYRRTLAQRNALLKRGPKVAQKQLFAWDVRLSELGSQLAQSRARIINQINKNIGKTYSQIAQQKSQLKLEYASQFPVESYASRFLKRLSTSVEQDYRLGFTAIGPHREDILFYLNKRLVSQTASRGETRSLVLALKVFELELVEKIRGAKAIFLLDDVFSELDGSRRRAVIDYLQARQSIITTTDAEAVVSHFTGATNVLPITRVSAKR